MNNSPIRQILVRCKSGFSSLIGHGGQRQLRRHGIVLISLVLFWQCVESVIEDLSNPSRWDWLLISGTITFILGIYWARRIPEKLMRALTHLVNQGTLLIDIEQLETLKEKLKVKAQIWENRSGLFSMAAIVIAFLVSTGLSRIPLMLIEAIAAYFAGGYLGRMAFYGLLRQLFQREALPLKVQPGHLDGASGFKPLGDFYFLQARVAAIPAVFLGTWCLLFSMLPHYAWWLESYLGLLVIAIVFELLAFTVPIWLFHLEMKRQKVQLLKDADHLSHSITGIKVQLANAQTTEGREQLKEQLEEQLSQVSKQCLDIEKMSTWPVGFKARNSGV